VNPIYTFLSFVCVAKPFIILYVLLYQFTHTHTQQGYPVKMLLCLAIVQSNCSVGVAFGLAPLTRAFTTNYTRRIVINVFGKVTEWLFGKLDKGFW